MRTFAALITNAMKLGGLIVALHELLFHSGALRSEALLEAAFMMSGAQLSEHLLFAILDRLLGEQEKKDKPRAGEKQ